MIKTDLRDKNLLVYHAYKETQLLHYNEPDLGIFIVESPYVIDRALEAGYEPQSFLIEKQQLNDKVNAIIKKYDVPTYVCEHDDLKNLIGYRMTRGMLCAMKRKPNPDIETICENKKIIVVLESIVNPTNIGAIIRSAAALGIEAVLLTKGCSDPLQRRASRVSMGNVFAVPWTYMDTHLVNVDLLKSMGFKIISMALSKDSVFLDEIESMKGEKIAIIMGTEGDGIDKHTLDRSDIVAKIPMQNGVDSLNVAAASAIAFWELNKRINV